MAQTFLVRLPVCYLMSIRPGASLTQIGLAAPCATVFGIVINLLYFLYYSGKMNREKDRKRKGREEIHGTKGTGTQTSGTI